MQEKYIKEVFQDYSDDNNLKDAKLENINLYKKNNKLQIKVVSSKKITLYEIEQFEKFLANKFKFEKVVVDILYDNNEFEIQDTIEADWNDIICYIGKKEPFSRAILKDSIIEKEGSKIIVRLSMKGAPFLLSKKFDKGIEHILKNLYNKVYFVEFIENSSQDLEKEIIKRKKQEEKEILQELERKAKLELEEINERKKAEAEKEKQRKEEEKEKLKEELKLQNPELAAKIEAYQNKSPEARKEESPLILGRNLLIKTPLMKIEDIPMDEETEMSVCVDGELYGDIESKDIFIKKTQKEKVLIKFFVFDGTCTIGCSAFVDKEASEKIWGRIKKSKGLRIEGNAKYSMYSKEVEILANTIIESTGIHKEEKRMDNAENKRVELHLHTQMSQMDAITPCKDILKRAVSWGWKSIAITDHGVVQSFPDAHKFLEETKNDLKVIYGVEGYFVPDKDPAVFFSKGQTIDDTEFCVFDLETTGFSHITEKITEVGIIKIKNGEIIDTFECFVNPEKPIPEEVIKVTHITDDMVKDAETIDKVMPKILKFMEGSVLVAHNADFDIGFMKYNCQQLRTSF